MADRVPGREDRLDAGQELLAILDEVDAVAHRREVLARCVEEDLERLRDLGLVGPEIVVGLGDVVLRVRKLREPSSATQPPQWSIWACDITTASTSFGSM